MAETLLKILTVILETLGPLAVREHVDKWEAARAPSDAAFRAKFGEAP